jgi:hypothetical protein
VKSVAAGTDQIHKFVLKKAPAPAKALKAEVDVDGVAAAKKATDGGLVVRSFDANGAPRKKITLKKVTDPVGFAGSLLVNCASDKIKIFDAAAGGTQVLLDGTHNKFANAGLPKHLWVEGAKASDGMADVEVTLDVDSGPAKADSFKVTVLWVDQPDLAFTGTVSADNAKREKYKLLFKSFTLGLQTTDDPTNKRMGWGSEASAKVHPPKFNYPGNDLRLERDYYFRDYNGSASMATGNYSASLPPGNDSSPDTYRDDDPDPNGIIYDVDAAGLNIPDAPAGTIHRTRNNFKSFASITVEGKKVRCSPVREYRIRFSQKQTKAPHGTEWKKLDPPDVADDNQAAHGTTKVTWDLK